ncbi:MAG: EamA family transporter [Bacteroidota bacterium]
MKNTSNTFFLFAIPALIWGSTWFVIKFQLGSVDPLYSVSYRFALGGILLMLYIKSKGLSIKFSGRIHFMMLTQGVFLFGLNYWLVYLSEKYLPSGLVAVTFSTLIFMNIIFGTLFLKSPLNRKVIVGALLGLAGTAVIYKPEIESFGLGQDNVKGLLLCLTGVVFASWGNIASARNQKLKIPVVQSNAFGMLYGSLFMFLIALFTGKTINFDFSFSYLSSLAYLSVFGSVIAFGSYVTLIGKVGADKAAYAILVIPVVALIISTIFEGYEPSLYTFSGVALILIGNLLALRVKKSRSS